MISLHHVHLMSSDIEATMAFWCQHFAAVMVLDTEFAGARNVFLRVGEGRLHLYAQPPRHQGPATVHHLGVETDELDALAERLKAAGVSVTEIRCHPEARYAMAQAPDGLLLELFQPEPALVDARWVAEGYFASVGGGGVARPRRAGVLAGTSASVAVRDATVDDAPGISALLTVLAEEFIVRDFTTEGRQHLLAHFGVTEMAQRLEGHDYRFLIAEDGAVLVGVVGVRAGTHLQYLFVAKSHHRTGLAQRLWALARSDAIRGGNAAGRFTVNASGYAAPAYERLGFRRVGPVRETNGVWFQPMELNGA